MATEQREYLGRDGTEELVATVKRLLASKADAEYVDNVIEGINGYILNIDYERDLAFDTAEIVIVSNTTSVLGQAILGQMILA